MLVTLLPPPETFAQRLAALRIEIEKITEVPVDVHATQLLSPEDRADAIERGMPL